jgi:hypothetical protein
MTAKKNTPRPELSNKAHKAHKAHKALKTAKGKTARPSVPAKPSAVTQGKKLSAIAAAARVLSETGRAMTCPELIEAMAAKRYWTSPGGRTPAATLYASIFQEIKSKGKDSRFRKTERGKFAATGVA